MTQKTKLASDTTIDTAHTFFGIKDEKGRSVGCRTQVRLLTFIEHPEPDADYGVYSHAAGDWFVAYYRVTRDGIEYGASNGREYFRTRAEADAYLAAQVAKCRKRYARKYRAAA